jgi:hypothetical protein
MFEVQNPCLTGDKHRGCYSPRPLKESCPEIQGERLSKEKKHVIHFPTFAIAFGYETSSIREDNWSRHFLILAFNDKLCLNNFLH